MMSTGPFAGGGRPRKRIGGLFDEDDAAKDAPPAAPSKTIKEYLCDTPAEPLSRAAKAAIWAAAIVVAALLAATIYRAAVPRAQASARTASEGN